MGGVLDAFHAFFEHLRAVSWVLVLLALVCQVAKMCARSRAWHNVLTAAYPRSGLRWRTVFGASAAGAAANAIAPVRAGDLLKLYLVKRHVDGARYPTLAASLFVETLADATLSGALLLWAVHERVLPGVRFLDRMPSVDWFWLFRHPRAATATAAAMLVLGFVLGLWAAARLVVFRRRVSQGMRSFAPRAAMCGVSSRGSSSTGLYVWGRSISSSGRSTCPRPLRTCFACK